VNAVVTKNIFIVRHGHAEHDGMTDFERPLSEKGIQRIQNSARFIQKHCQALNLKHLLCISSAATRTVQTANIIDDNCQFENIQTYRELYTSTVSTWLDKCIQAPEENIVIVGHNPTFSQMINNLCGYQMYMKPANCAFIQLEIKADGIIYPASLIEFYNNE
jgi:phosphohistidine phosphatase SixA